MAPAQLYYLTQIEKTTTRDDDPSSSNPLLGLVDFFLYVAVFNKVQSVFSQFLFFLLSKLNSKARIEKGVSHSELSHQERLIHGSRDDGFLRRNEVKMVMEKLGFFCSSESEELEENYGFNELSEVFEEEPSLEEVKQAFDVFDENRDGFIDDRELQRVLCILGLKEAASDLGNCQKMIRNFDENADGRIDFKEFVRIMEKSFC